MSEDGNATENAGTIPKARLDKEIDKRKTMESELEGLAAEMTGAVPERLFQAQCIRCGECTRACPTNTLQPAWLRAGPTGMFSPCLTPVHGPCEHHCPIRPARALVVYPRKIRLESGSHAQATQARRFRISTKNSRATAIRTPGTATGTPCCPPQQKNRRLPYRRASPPPLIDRSSKSAGLNPRQSPSI